MDALRKDLAYALRSLLKRPLFTVVAALSLAIGIGATTSMFSVFHVFAFRPAPGVEGWDRAVEIGRGTRGRGFDTFSYPDFEDVREGVPALEEVAGWRSGSFSLGTDEGGVRMTGMYVTANYFDALGVRPARGRTFTADEEGAAADGVVVVSDRFWRDHMEASPEALGSTVRLNRRPMTVIGVLPPAFVGHYAAIRTDLYVPLPLVTAMNEVRPGTLTNRGSSWMQVVGRLAPGATVEEADAQVSALFQRLQEAYPDSNRDRTARVIPLGPIPGGGRAPALGFLGALLGLVVLVLLVTCANVAGMFLARAAAREREIAIRLAVGSGRARLVRQLLTEAVLLFALGGGGGVLLAWWGMGFVDLAALPLPFEVSLDLRPDPLVLGAGLGLALLTGLVFGLAPAIQAVRTDILPSLKTESGSGGGRVSRLRKAFASGQVALSLVLLVAGGLFLRSLQEAATVHTGFEPADAYATTLDLDIEGYDEASGVQFLDRLRQRVAAIPGVEAVALGSDLPLDLGSRGTSIRPEGWEGPEERLGVEFNQVTPGWFETLGTPVLQGRIFDEGDRAGSQEVAIVSRALAERVWPGQDPLGRTFEFSLDGSVTVTVVGVVEDVKNQTLMEEDDPFVYRPLAQAYEPDVTLAVRSARPHGEIAAAVRSAILEVDPSVSLTPVRSVDRLTSIGVLPQRMGASVAGILGMVALVLSGLGVYGVIAFVVQQRTREIGVRMALGAGTARVLRHILGGGLELALPGLAVGAALAAVVAVGLSRLHVLLGVEPADPATLLAVAALLLAVVLLASAIPARRAAGVPPSEALRHE